MAKFYSELDEKLTTFIRAQPVFFTATAPASGRINLSPKGMDTFRVLSPKLVGYLDLTGSGNETSAHLQENGRITLMFCSFTKTPLILRLYGRGRVVRPSEAEWGALAPNFPALPGTRQIILLDIESLNTSCGFGVPVFGVPEERPTLVKWAESAGEAALADYRAEKNTTSIDGMPVEV